MGLVSGSWLESSVSKVSAGWLLFFWVLFLKLIYLNHILKHLIYWKFVFLPVFSFFFYEVIPDLVLMVAEFAGYPGLTYIFFVAMGLVSASWSYSPVSKVSFYSSTFYLLDIEFQLFFFFFFLWSYHVLIWFIKNWFSNFFSCVSSMWLSQSYVHGHEVYEFIHFN